MPNYDYLNQHILIKEMGASFVYKKMPTEICDRAINIQEILNEFPRGGRIDLKKLKRKKLVSKQVNYIKVVGTSPIDKRFKIVANKFGLTVVKNVIDSGGKIVCVAYKNGEEPCFNNIMR